MRGWWRSGVPCQINPDSIPKTILRRRPPPNHSPHRIRVLLNYKTDRRNVLETSHSPDKLYTYNNYTVQSQRCDFDRIKPSAEESVGLSDYCMLRSMTRFLAIKPSLTSDIFCRFVYSSLLSVWSSPCSHTQLLMLTLSFKGEQVAPTTHLATVFSTQFTRLQAGCCQGWWWRWRRPILSAHNPLRSVTS